MEDSQGILAIPALPQLAQATAADAARVDKDGAPLRGEDGGPMGVAGQDQRRPYNLASHGPAMGDDDVHRGVGRQPGADAPGLFLGQSLALGNAGAVQFSAVSVGVGKGCHLEAADL